MTPILMRISLKGLDKALVLAALYNSAKPQGLGFLHFTPEDMTVAQAQDVLLEHPRMYFDYVQGRVMKVDLSGDELDPRLYDRNNGEGAAQVVIERLRAAIEESRDVG